MTGRLFRVAACAWPFAVLFFIFFWPLILLQTSFIGYDYRSQHFPWAMETFQAIREGTLPFWTDKIGGGFPLFAEGQCASLYLLNWVAYRLLPFLAAYTWSIPFHFLIGGAGMFLYIRKLGPSREAAGMAAAVFCFASAYAGCFYNTGSLRTLCWLPLTLWLLERSRSGEDRALNFMALSAIVSQQWMAGFPQMAVYAFGYLVLHELLAFLARPDKARAVFTRTVVIGCLAPLALGTLIAWPQIAATLELIGLSIRQGESASFALWGSVPPLAPVSLVYPEWGNALRFCFYTGILPLLLVLAFFCAPRQASGRRHAWLLLIFFLLALGKFNPVYRWAVESFGLTSMRNPAKFLFFCATSLSVLAAFGYDAVVSMRDQAVTRRRFGRVLALFAALTMALPLAAQAALGYLEPKKAAFSQWMVTRMVAERGDAAKDPSYYSGRLDSFFEGLGPLFSYRNPFNVESVLLAASACLVLAFFLRKSLPAARFHFLAGVVLVWDLAVFGFTLGTGFIGNAAPLESLAPTDEMRRVLAHTDKEPALFAELVEDPSRELFHPNSNMTYGVKQPGAYSPLLLKKHYETAKPLGIVDGSLGRDPMSVSVWTEKRPLVDFFGVRYLHTDKPLDWEGLKALERGDDFYLYENLRAHPPAAAIPQGEVEELPQESSSRRHFRFRMSGDGLGMVRMPPYPGWKVWVDGKLQPWRSVYDLFLSFPLTEGRHEVEMRFEPTGWLWRWAVSLFAVVVTVMGGILIQISDVRSYNRRSNG